MLMMLERMHWSNTILLGALIGVCPWAAAQAIPNVTCTVEDYPVKAVVAWQFPQVQNAVQVVVLRDPSGKQEARFDLTHGASLLSLREEGKEMLFGQTAGASVSLFSVRTSPSPELKGMSPYWSAYSPDQGGSSMGIPATTTGVACEGQRTMRAFAVMQDRGSDSSFQKRALLGLEGGKISDNFPAGYSTPYVLETVASWVPNPGKTPEFYLKLDQTVVNTGPGPSGPLEWYLNVAAPWGDEHATSFPEKCTSKTPCTSREVKALASGRYADAGQTEGVAMVVPTAGWRADEAYVQPNAEYVVLLYNAVWAAPRRTFATVLRRPLDGVGAYHFSWYVCAGAWQAAKQFAQEQTAGDQEQPLTEPQMTANEPSKNPVVQACETTEFKPQPNQTDRAVVLRDPANEQTVLFDTSQGGAIVSLNYGGREHVWGYNGGGLLQMAFHNSMHGGAWDGDYNPTQAGDGSANSQVTGIACDANHSVTLETMMLDFNHNNAFYAKPLIAVWDGRVNTMLPLSYSSPYVLETQAEWVRNPAGAPQYYLRLRQRLVHVADETIGRFGFDFAAYMPWDLSTRAVSPDHCPCNAATTTYVVGGWYESAARERGMAVAMPSSQFAGKEVGGGFNSDYMWRNRSFHLNSSDAVDGIAAKEFVWYAMSGPWANAERFARSLR